MIYSLNENGERQSVEAPADELDSIRAMNAGNGATIGDMLDTGEACFIGGRWVFLEYLRTTLGMQEASTLLLKQGRQEPRWDGDCPVHWFEAWHDGELVKRAANVIAVGVETRMTLEAGNVG
jgi:hypothetical protein